MNSEPQNNIKRQIIEQELALWSNTRYQLQMRYRVNKSIGSPEEALKRIEDELTKCEQAIDILSKELSTLEK